MELLYFFLGAACALIAGLLMYLVILQLEGTPRGGQALVEGRAERKHIVLEGSDFKLLTRTAELILVPVTLRAEEFLNHLPDTATAPYYRAIIVARENLPKFAEHCLTAGLIMAREN